MSVNRIGKLVDARHQPPPAGAEAALSFAMDAGAGRCVRSFQQEHPGEQCYLLVLDTSQGIVRDLMRDSGMLEAEAAARAAVSKQERSQPDVGLWITAVPREAGVRVARYFAKDEPGVQAICDRLSHEPVLAICVTVGGMSMGPLDPAVAHPADTERARRQARAKRHR
jgi:hypothetical protein